MIQYDEVFRVRIRVIGVGGCGGNAVNAMVDEGIDGVELFAVNTDQQVLDKSKAHEKIRIGEELTKGRGAGGDPEIGRQAAEESVDALRRLGENAEMVFIVAGMGGGTGTGASPIIAKIAKDMGVLTVGVVTKPFGFEGEQKKRIAEEGVRELKKNVDTLLVIPNDKLMVFQDLPLIEILNKPSNDILVKAVKGISELVTKAGFINRDFADLRRVMSRKGKAIMSIGTGRGEKAHLEAAESAINSPLLEDVSIQNAKSMLVNLTVNPKTFMTGHYEEAMKILREHAGDNAEMLMGVVFEEIDEVRITLIATGIPDDGEKEMPLEVSEESDYRIDGRDISNIETPAFMRRARD